jgi:serine/threonine protein kinase
MSYCLNPGCPKPENPDDVHSCQSCSLPLLLKERYRATEPIGQGGFGKTFLAVDEHMPSKRQCVIKQFFNQSGLNA